MGVQSERLETSREPWIVVNTRPHAENTALDNLQRQAFDAYCPMLRKHRSHARSVTMVLRPLFPGYLFVRAGPELGRWRSILSTYGVRNVVRAGETPSVIDNGFIASLKEREINGAIVRPPNPYRIGQKVEIAGGAFDGIVATIIQLDADDRVVVLLELMKHTTKATLNSEQLTPH
jgi:transcriptional antiterminator RfaH